MKETNPTTRRLRELEADVKRYGDDGIASKMLFYSTVVEGYRMALEDLWPVVEAAKLAMNDWEGEPCPIVHDADDPCWRDMMEDALAVVEVVADGR